MAGNVWHLGCKSLSAFTEGQAPSGGAWPKPSVLTVFPEVEQKKGPRVNRHLFVPRWKLTDQHKFAEIKANGSSPTS